MKKKKLILTLVLILSIFAGNITAQVTVGSDAEPDGSAVLDVVSTTKGFLPPRVSTVQRDAIQLPATGLVIYNTTLKCIEFNMGTPTAPVWTCVNSASNGTVESLDCAGGTYTGGTLTDHEPIEDVVSFEIPYEGGNGGTYSAQVILSTGVSGIMASRTAGALENGSGTLTYTISGTPQSAGTATFFIELGGKTCSFTLPTVKPAPLPGNIQLYLEQTHYIASTYDNDYLPLAANYKSAPAEKGSLAADGVLDPLINVQGKLPVGGAIIRVPYQVVNAPVNLPAFSQKTIVSSEYIQGTEPLSNESGGDPVAVTISYPALSLPVGTGTIPVTIKPESELNAVKLDMNKGIGSDRGIKIAEWTLVKNADGDEGKIYMRIIGGLADRNFGDGIHNMLYLPVKADDGRYWLTTNLGTNYNIITNGNFDIRKTPTGSYDPNAVGSRFQWGRQGDGHELSGAQRTKTKSPTHVPGHNKFIEQPEHWDASLNPNLWKAPAYVNNPCPKGYHVPTRAEWTTYNNIEGGGIDISTLYGSSIHLVAHSADNRYTYWTGDNNQGPYNIYFHAFTFQSGHNEWSGQWQKAEIWDDEPAAGHMVRCIMD